MLQRYMSLYESTYYVDEHGMAHDDEGNFWNTDARSGIYGLRNAPKSNYSASYKSQYQKNDIMLTDAAIAVPNYFTLQDISRLANTVKIPSLSYKQKFGIIINKAKQMGKKQK